MNERAIFTRDVCKNLLISNNIQLPTKVMGKALTSKDRLNILLNFDYQRTADCLAPILFYADKMNKKDQRIFFKKKINNIVFFTNLLLRENNVKEYLMMLAKRGFISGKIFSDSSMFSAFTTVFWEDFPEFFKEVISHLNLDKIVYREVLPSEDIDVKFSLRDDLKINIEDYYILDEVKDSCLALIEE